ncbi:MAG: type II toxin-antitoxin system RelE/ParE family toxin, partial [Gammaproteobacteria bacterium]|nr:type II toxin-antitoxin system RelE/ParE family toxin [Gammaproteobacteria bacterium]
MKIFQTNQFKKEIKKLHPNQKREVDVAVRAIVKDPDLGHPKIGDL